MHRSIVPICCVPLLGILIGTSAGADAQAGGWGTLKGRVVWGGKDLPKPSLIDVKVDPQHCLQANKTADADKSTIQDEKFLINAKNKGLKNVFVFIMVEQGGKVPTHPDLQKFPPEVELDQPACMFFPRAVAMREGQTLVVKNSAPVQHNIRWIGDPVAGNQGGNVTLKPGDKFEVKDLKAQRLPLALECNIHGWMKGRLGVFSHPYYTITDDDGKFELKNAPVGAFRLMIYHEEIGYRLGLKGKSGEDVTINAAGTDMGDLPMGK